MCLRRARAGLLCLSSVQSRATPRGVPSPGRGGLAWPRRAGPNVESAFGILDFARIDHRGHTVLLHDEHDPGLHVTCTCIRCRAANRGAPLVCAPVGRYSGCGQRKCRVRGVGILCPPRRPCTVQGRPRSLSSALSPIISSAQSLVDRNPSCAWRKSLEGQAERKSST